MSAHLRQVQIATTTTTSCSYADLFGVATF
jgi:hypothetical protein